MSSKRRSKPPTGDASRGSIKARTRLPNAEAERLFARVAEEVLHDDRTLFDSLNQYERNLVIRALSDAIVDPEGHSALHDVLWEVDYHTKPVSIETFIHDPYYLGKVASELHPKWKEDLFSIFAPGSPVFEWVMTGAIGIGKGLAVDDVVLTPTGWKRAGDVRVGDRLIGQDGRPTRVEGVFPRGRLSMYRVYLDDTTSLRVDGDHLWTVQTPSQRYRGGGWRTLPTRELLHDHTLKLDGQKKWHIPLTEPVEFDPGEPLPIDPYALGVLLGDGCLVSGSVRLSSMDVDLVEDVACRLGLRPEPAGDGCDYRLVRDRGDREGHPLQALRDLGVCVLSQHKSVPERYLFASIQDRLALLRGLMDTDGWVQNQGKSSLFSSSSPQLSADVQFLVQSLGGVASYNRKSTTHLDAHIVDLRLTVNPFLLPRKANEWRPAERYRPRRMIEAIVPDGEDDVVCFKVAAEDGLFLARDCIVTHNTTLASIGMAYKLYQMSCLRDAPTYYGLLPESLIVFGVYSITKHQVADTGYFMVKGMIDTSPYFRLDFPRNAKIDSVIDFGPTTGRKIKVIPGSQELHALGLDLFSFLMDEVNFMRVKDDKELGIQTGQAYKIYNATYTRLQSRFIRPGGTLPGMMFLLSSRNAQTSFLEEHLAEVRNSQHSHRTHISDYALWEVKPAHKFTMSRFKVEVGDRTSRSRLLTKADLVDGGGGQSKLVIHGEDPPRKNARVVEVPGEFWVPFTKDIDQALRDIAGVATFGLSPLIHDRQSIYDSQHPDMEHPFTAETLVVSNLDDVQIADMLDVTKIAHVVRSRWVPLLNPTHPRFIHVDIGLRKDAYGFAMGHVAGSKKVTHLDLETGLESVEDYPVIVIDLMFRAKAPPGGEVELIKGVTFIRFLAQMFQIAKVTYDGFESANAVQMLNRGTRRAVVKPGAPPVKDRRGIEAGILSVDRDEEAYLLLRAAHFERRMFMYRYDPYVDEVLDLQRDVVKRKVDHPMKSTKGGNGSKDVSDGVAGVVYHCMNDPRALQVVTLPEFEAAANGEAPVELRIAPSHGHAASDRKVGVNGVSWEELRKNLRE